MLSEIETIGIALKMVVLSLAIWRISSIINREVIFAPARSWLGVVETDTKIIYPNNFIGKLISCIRCLSVWVSLAFIISYYFLPTATMVVATVFALSAGAIFVEKTTRVKVVYADNPNRTDAR